MGFSILPDEFFGDGVGELGSQFGVGIFDTDVNDAGARTKGGAHGTPQAVGQFFGREVEARGGE
ncbi:MAG: hypothetical protein PCFJNLEI_02242 [Verrucomicrobiae bacterium]|nr:hypothetical protein [Verrucomicrobiae bacterium]